MIEGERYKGRQYVRKFDHDEALRRYQAGEYPTALAREYGVSVSAIHRIVYPGVIASEKRAQAKMRAKGRCERCGGWKHGATKARLCQSCAWDDLATSVRDSELHCVTCGEWKPDEEFPHNRSERIRRRGRHKQCRACQTIARRDHRRRNREAENTYAREYKRRRRAEQKEGAAS